ncbi:MAG: methyl-accepting chemotaxis protein [Deltaproteobacteria bacterium]|nr:methyl-accepting chemotaxis protein [Deltaproteobacteria bacterium]
MDKSIPVSRAKKIRQHCFVARELQITIALLVVLALLGGAFLQSIFTKLNTYFGFTTPVLSIFLTIGYIALVAFLAIFFAHRFLGPFKRLEYEMKVIMSGALDKRLTVRTKDDLYVRNFVAYVNKFIENFENTSKDYNNLHSAISTKLTNIIKKIEQGQYNMEDIKETLKTLQQYSHESREKW